MYKLTQFFCRHTKNFHSDVIQHICEVPGCGRVFENYDRRAAHYREDHDYQTEVKPILEALRNIRAAARQRNRVQRPALRIDRQRFQRFGSENIVYRNPQPENIKSNHTFFDRMTKDIELVRVALLLTGCIQGIRNTVADYLNSFIKVILYLTIDVTLFGSIHQ